MAPARKTYLSTAQAAEYLGVHVASVRRYVADGSLPAHRIRGKRMLRFDLTDLESMLGPV